MPKRASPRTPRLGKHLEHKRAGRTREVVVRLLKTKAGVTIDPSALYKYERGQMPPLDVLRGLATVYRDDIGRLVTLAFSNEKAHAAEAAEEDREDKQDDDLSELRAQGMLRDNEEVRLLQAYRELTREGKQYILGALAARLDAERAVDSVKKGGRP